MEAMRVKTEAIHKLALPHPWFKLANRFFVDHTLIGPDTTVCTRSRVTDPLGNEIILDRFLPPNPCCERKQTWLSFVDHTLIG